MAIAILTLDGLLAPLRGMAAWLRHPPKGHGAAHQGHPPPRFAAPAPRLGRPLYAASSRGRPRRPLRVVRVMEESAIPAGAGRMLISGRMADVCAELDRLAALEGQALPPAR